MRRATAENWLFGIFTVLTVLVISSSGLTDAISDKTDSPAWANPSVMVLKRIGAAHTVQDQPNLFSNLDCTSLTYRLSTGSSMQSGCFSNTAFGLMDSDSGIVIFNGTDEGVPLLGYLPHQVIAPWPSALGLLSLNAVSTGGSYISLYRNPLSVLQDERNNIGQLAAKQLRAPPDLQLVDPSGQPLIVDAQTLAFSAGGSWLVAEDLSGSFVRINLATLEMTAFAPSFDRPGFPALPESPVAVSEDGRYVAIESNDVASLKVYDLTTCTGAMVNLQPESCQSYDYWPFVGRQITDLQSIRHVRFVTDSLISFEAVAKNGNESVYELAPTSQITSLIGYLGMGDSYTSGEGAFDYLAGTDTGDNHCHLSVHSYPLLLSRDVFGPDGGYSVACSGAVVNDVGSTEDSYSGQVTGGQNWRQLEPGMGSSLDSIEADFMPGYVAQQRFAEWYQPRVMTVSIGGNDIGFGDIIRTCVEPHVGLGTDSNTCYTSYEDRQELINLIDRTGLRLSALYRQLEAETLGSRLYAIGYPEIVFPAGDCALNVHLNHAELLFASELTNYMNSVIQQAAEAAGAEYIDITQALAGHRLCESASYDVAVNGLTAGNDAGPLGLKIFGAESYHPNALGQALIEQAILEQTNNFTGISPPQDGQTVLQALLDAPSTGRPLNVLVPDDSLTAGVFQPSAAEQLTANGIRDGLVPNATYNIRFDGSGGVVIRSATSDSTGSISTTFTVPLGTAPGGHTLDITGSNQAGEPVDVRQPIYIMNNEADSDGDHIPDNTDSCPGAVNSNLDTDHDGIDDVCDSLIGRARPSGYGSPPISQDNVASEFSEMNEQKANMTILPEQGILSTDAVPHDITFINPHSANGDRINQYRAVQLSQTLHRPVHDSARQRIIINTVSQYRPRTIPWLPYFAGALILWLIVRGLDTYMNRRTHHS